MSMCVCVCVCVCVLFSPPCEQSCKNPTRQNSPSPPSKIKKEKKTLFSRINVSEFETKLKN